MAEFNVLLIGEHGVGKTALLLRHLTGEFFQGGEAAKLGLVTWQQEWEGIQVSLFIGSSLFVHYFQNLHPTIRNLLRPHSLK